jgi:hypothetical protein
MKTNTITALSLNDESMRKTALTAGIIYLITFVSIPTLTLYGPIHQPGYTVQGGDPAIALGVLLEVIVAFSGIGTAIALYPVLKRQNAGLSMALIAARVVEAGTIIAGTAALLTAVSLLQPGAGAVMQGTGRAFVNLYDRIFLMGQSLMPAVDDLLLGILLYQSRLVPRALSLTGIAGAVMLFAGDVAVWFGLLEQRAILASASAIGVALFEFSLGILLVVKGFNSNHRLAA